jgi:Glycosyl transferase family 2
MLKFNPTNPEVIRSAPAAQTAGPGRRAQRLRTALGLPPSAVVERWIEGTNEAQNGGTTNELDHALLQRARERGERPKDPRVTVVIPTLNEAENLPLVLPKLSNDVHEVVLVDGASVDGTIETARRLYPGIRAVKQRGSGKGDALRTGFAAATGEIVVMLDADGSADPTEIAAFVGTLLSGADFAKGSRFLHGAGTADMTLFRRFGNRCLVLLVRLLYGGRYTDLCYGYNAFWKDVLPALQLNCDGFEVETAMNIRALKARLHVVEVASFERPRVYGISKLRTIADGWRVLKTILRERIRRLPPQEDLHVDGEKADDVLCPEG